MEKYPQAKEDMLSAMQLDAMNKQASQCLKRCNDAITSLPPASSLVDKGTSCKSDYEKRDVVGKLAPMVGVVNHYQSAKSRE